MNTENAALDVAASTHRCYAVAPKIGELLDYEGGIYAGIVRGDPGQPDYRLIVCAEDNPKVNWADAGAWAAGLEADGHKDFTLPKRKEQAILFGNVPELFEADWYWSNAQCEHVNDYAWFQHFSLGSQYDFLKDNHCRARAVRRVAI
jgi:hypothetical protein